MMQQYMEIKEQSKDCILFFRLGDFYEMFFEDAKTASRELELVLTGRDCGMEQRAPMCGLPYHAAPSYVARLITKGYKVAICEQVEDPALAKGIVKREIVHIYTPGTVTDDNMLDKKKNNYILAIYEYKGMYGLAAADLSTGELQCTSLTIGNTKGRLIDETARYAPSEIIINSQADDLEKLKAVLMEKSGAYVGNYEQRYFTYDECLERMKALNTGTDFSGRKYDLSINAAGALVHYMLDTQKINLGHIRNIGFYSMEEFMLLDSSSRKNLELTETMRDKNRKGSLLWVLDRTQTSMGGRMLRKWIEQPLIDTETINERLDAVCELKNSFMIRSELREILCGIYDIERLTGKIVLGTVNARDIISLKQSLGQIPYVKGILTRCSCPLITQECEMLDELKDVYDLIENSIEDEPPIGIKDGGIIKVGYNEEVDFCKRASREGKEWLAELEAKERSLTGIKNLKIGYNRVFGYYIEVTRSNFSMVPEHYVRKQTLAGNERYITDELKKMEDTILGAEEKLINLEYEIFIQIREQISQNVDRLKNTAFAIARLDALASFAEVADRENYIRPLVNNSNKLCIEEGRHPVVEKIIGTGAFVPNDALVDSADDVLLVITGPNMAGKSTYMRQVALIVLMAQAGSFIPAASAEIGIVDRIFTRVGASDDLASGQSTFMVEMTEVANILTNATKKSLLILDEIGRGTSTFDGLSIAWAVLEYIIENISSRTLFATHYHELTELEGKIPGIKNYCVDVKKKGDDIVFLRKIKRGGADGSYGIQVAGLAGVPKAVTMRASEILVQLEEQDISRKELKIIKKKKQSEGQLDIFSFTTNVAMRDEIIEELKAMDIQSITPIEALNRLYSLYQKAMNRK